VATSTSTAGQVRGLVLIDAAITLDAALDRAKSTGRAAAVGIPAARRAADSAVT
jgi:hypothetical protein